MISTGMKEWSQLRSKVWTLHLQSGFYILFAQYTLLGLSCFFGPKLDGGYYYFQILLLTSSWEVTCLGKLSRCVLTLTLNYHMLIGAISIVLYAFEFIALATDCVTANCVKNRSGHPAAARADYAAISILVCRVNKIARWTVSIATGLGSGIFVVSMSVAIKYYGKVDIFVYLIFIICSSIMIFVMGLICPFAAKLNIVSVQFVDEWGRGEFREGGVKRHVRLARAMKTIGMECSGVGIIGRVTLLHMFAAWLDNTMTVVLGLN